MNGGSQMETKSVKLVCFSPTGTTKTVLESIGTGLNLKNTELIDITLPDARKTQLELSDKDLLIIGVPVYSGRAAGFVSEWLNTIKADNTPAVCVVVYGNREYDDALLELNHIMIKRGCIPVASGAFIGEHSFSHSEAPIAVSRPDSDDLGKAVEFGVKIKEKLFSISALKDTSCVEVPGNYPYKEIKPLGAVDFIAVDEEICTKCGACEKICPARAISIDKEIFADTSKCIFCCACIKICPVEARSIKQSEIKDIAVRLSEGCTERKEPECFL